MFARPRSDDPRFWAPALVFAMTLIVFWPATRNGFVNWDDRGFVLSNPYIQKLSWINLKWMFTSVAPGTYHPLSWLSLALDHAVWGMNAFGYHLTSILLHSANAALLAIIAALLLRAARGIADDDDDRPWWWGGLAGLLFAIHPLRVESVAWISDRRDVLCGFFFLLSTLLYIKEKRALSIVAFAAALFSKASAVPLPLTLFILDFYPLRRSFTKASVVEKMPYFVLAIPFAFIGARLQGYYAAEPYHFDALQRVALAAERFLHYPIKTAWPQGLAPGCITPFHPNPLDWKYLLSGAIIVIGAGIIYRWRCIWAGAASLYYTALILPVIGLTSMSPQFVADRYTYLACLPWAVLCSAGLASARSRRGLLASLTVSMIMVGTLFGMTRIQISYWQGSQTLWSRAVAVIPDSVIARENLGDVFTEQGRLLEARDQFRQALRTRPDYAPAHYGLGRVYAAGGAPGVAERYFFNAIRLDPANLRVYNDLSLILFGRGKKREAIAILNQGLSVPVDQRRFGAPAIRAGLYNNLGNVLRDLGENAQAVQAYQQAIMLAPKDPRAHYNYGLVLLRLNEPSQAVAAFQEALRLDANFPRAAASLAAARAAAETAGQARALNSKAKR